MNARLIDITGKVTLIPISADITVQDIKNQLSNATKKKYDLIFCGRKLEDIENLKSLEDVELNFIVVQEVINKTPRNRRPHFAMRNIEEEILQRTIQESIVQNSRPSQRGINHYFSMRSRGTTIRPPASRQHIPHRLTDPPPPPAHIFNDFPYREQLQPSTAPLPVHTEPVRQYVPEIMHENNVQPNVNESTTPCSLRQLEIPEPEEQEYRYLSSDDEFIATD